MLNTLQTTGVAVYSLPNIDFNPDRFTSQQLEFVDLTKSLRVSARGLMGNPSSQHCEEIRRVRQSIYDQLRPQLAKEFPGKYVQFVVDRVSVRYRDTSVSGDDWHRDTSGPPEEGTRIFGGWFNLNSTDTTAKKALQQTQYFSHVPCSWADVLPTGDTGYDRLSPDDSTRYKRLKNVAKIPPGHGVIFDENTVHDVKADRRPKDSSPSWRVYIKVKISTNDNVLFGQDTIMTRLVNQAMMPLNLTDECPMYDQRHVQFWLPKLIQFSTNVKPVFLASVERKIVKRFMISLQAANNVDPTIGMHPGYTIQEITHLLPTLLLPATDVQETYLDQEIRFDFLDKPYKRAKSCPGCLNKSPNQVAHMDTGGCFDPALLDVINDLY